MKKIVCLLLLSGLAMAATDSAAPTPPAPPKAAAAAMPPMPPRPPMMDCSKMQLDSELTQSLKLDATKTTALATLMQKHCAEHKQMHEKMMAEHQGDREAMHAKHQKELSAILSPEQMKAFEQFHQAHHPKPENMHGDEHSGERGEHEHGEHEHQ